MFFSETGLCMVYLWSMYGLCMVNVWFEGSACEK